MNRQMRYNNLVNERKVCRLCTQSGLTNPACIDNGKYDSDHIGPWSYWQGNLNAEIMVVGQDWGDVNYFVKMDGSDELSGNPTNTNLLRLLNQFKIFIDKPNKNQNIALFFTNIILCLKNGGLQAPIKREWVVNCTYNYFHPLVEIIQPKIILALGKSVSESILDLYGIKHSKSGTLSRLMSTSPYKLTEATFLFPLYHCGAGGVNRNRSMEKQQEDWLKAAEWFRHQN